MSFVLTMLNGLKEIKQSLDADLVAPMKVLFPERSRYFLSDYFLRASLGITFLGFGVLPTI